MKELKGDCPLRTWSRPTGALLTALIINLAFPGLLFVGSLSPAAVEGLLFVAVFFSPVWFLVGFMITLTFIRVANEMLKSRLVCGAIVGLITAPLWIGVSVWDYFLNPISYLFSDPFMREAVSFAYFFVIAYVVGYWIQPRLRLPARNYVKASMQIVGALAVILVLGSAPVWKR